jgi:Leucine-rich repeat (LRR) protein
MELVRGRSAGDAVAGANPMPWREATRVIADACRGLAAAHKAGLIHRDIKPANIMITEDGPAKLADFGLAKASGLGGVGSMAGPTGTGMVVGTPHYMSPEQAQAKPLDGRSDLYSLGATYLTLLTGRTPFPAEAPMQILYAHCTAPVPDPREVVPDLPDAAVEVVMRAMAKDPAERFPNAESMLAALEAVLSGEPSIQVEVLGAASFGRGATGGVSGLHGIGPAGPVTAPGLRAAATRRLPQPSRSGMSPAVAVACAVASAVAVVLVGVWAFGPRKTDKLADTKTPTPGQSTLASASGGTGGTNGTGGIGGTSTDPGTLTPIEPPPDVDPPRITRPDPRPTGKSGPRTGFGGNERPDPQPGPGPGPGPLTRPEYGPGPGPGLGPGPGFGPESGARASPESPPPPPPPAPPFRASHEAYDVVCFELARGNPGWRADGGDFWPRQGREMEGLVLPAEGLEMLAQLEWLTGLKSIKLTGSGGDEKRRVVRDVWFTRSMPQLESLDVSDTAVRFIGPVKDCKRLRWLKLTGTPVRDLTPLKGLPLEELDITDSQVSDLSPLKGMRLKLLWLGNTAVTDLSPLRGMKSLENLQFDGSKVRDLSPLEGLRLKVLWCQGLGGDGKAVSLDVLKTMPELTELSCDISSDADRELLRSLKSLRKLNDKPVEEALRK